MYTLNNGILSIDDPVVFKFCTKHKTFNPNVILLTFIDQFNNANNDAPDKDQLMLTLSTFQDSMLNRFNTLEKDLVSKHDTSLSQLSGNLTNTVTSSVAGATSQISSNVNSIISNTSFTVPTDSLKEAIMSSMPSDQGVYLQTQVSNLHDKLSTVKEALYTVQNDLRPIYQMSNNTMSTLGELSKKFINSGNKGKAGEEFTEKLLKQTFPTHRVTTVASSLQKGQMDIRFESDNLPTIGFEVKNYKDMVPHNQVEKFERDILESNTHGIMLSLTSGISGKPHQHLNILSNKCVALYLSCNDFDAMSSIQTAVSAIYLLDPLLKANKDVEGNSLTVTQDTVNLIRGIIDKNKKDMGEIERTLKDLLEKVKRMTWDEILSLLGVTGAKVKITKSPNKAQKASVKISAQIKEKNTVMTKVNDTESIDPQTTDDTTHATDTVLQAHNKVNCVFCNKQFMKCGIKSHTRRCKKQIDNDVAMQGVQSLYN